MAASLTKILRHGLESALNLSMCEHMQKINEQINKYITQQKVVKINKEINKDLKNMQKYENKLVN